MEPIQRQQAHPSPVRRYLVLPLLEVLTALRLIFLTRPVVQHPCWAAGRVRASVASAPYRAPVPADPRVVLDCIAPWEDRAGAVAASAPLECVVRARFADGTELDVVATASAWSREAVQVFFPHPTISGPAYRVWVPAARVSRLQRDEQHDAARPPRE